MPISEKQLAANRANATRSTGPRTIEGKGRTRMNSLIHGLRSQDLLLPNEDPAPLEELRQSYIAQYRPSTAAELYCVEKMLQAHWRTRRIPGLEAALFEDQSNCLEGLSRLSRYETSLDRAFYRALAELRTLQAERKTFVSFEPAAEQVAEPATQAEPAPPEQPSTKMGSLGRTFRTVANVFALDRSEPALTQMQGSVSDFRPPNGPAPQDPGRR